MKKIIVLLGVVFLSSCETSDTCQCEVYENIGTEEQPQLRFIGKLDGNCESQTKKEEYIYQSVSCD